MNKYLTYLNYIQYSIGVVFSLLIAYVAVESYFGGRPDLTPGRICLAVVLAAYSLMNIRMQKTNGFYFYKMYLFPIIYIVFGLLFEFWSRGYIKNWAPSTAEEALEANIFFLFILCLLFVAGTVTTLYKPKVGKNV